MSFWNTENTERLKVLWSEGFPASRIARELGAVSRNAIVGKAHRLNLSERVPGPPPEKRKARAVARVQKKYFSNLSSPPATVKSRPTITAARNAPKLVARPITQLEKPESLDLTLVDLRDDVCKFPNEGDGPAVSYRFCGHPSFGGHVYCEYHTRLAYQPKQAAA